MRYSSIGRMLLVTAVAISSSVTARAQFDDYSVPGRPEIIAPIPTGNPSGNGFFVNSSFVILTQTFALGKQDIAVRGLLDSTGALTGAPGTLIGSGRVALSTEQFGRRSFQPGYNIGFGYKFDNGVAVYANFTQTTRQKYSAGASLVPPFFRGSADLSDTFLTSPVFNFPPDYSGPDLKTTFDTNPAFTPGNFYGIWNGASVMDIQFNQSFTQGEMGARVPIFQTEYSRVYGLAGARYAWFLEQFYWRTVSIDLIGRAFPSYAAEYKNTLSQRMYGPYLGCGHEIYLGKRLSFGLDLTGSALMSITKERVKYELGDHTTQAKRSRNEFNIVPNVNADFNLMWYPIEGVQMRAGYTFQSYFNTRYMKEPVAFDFGALDPVYSTRAYRFVSGVNFGVGFFF